MSFRRCWLLIVWKKSCPLHTSEAEQSKEFENSGPEFEFSYTQYKLLGMLTYFFVSFCFGVLWSCGVFLFVYFYFGGFFGCFIFLNQSPQNTFHGLFARIQRKKKNNKKEAQGHGVIPVIDKNCFHICIVVCGKSATQSKKKCYKDAIKFSIPRLLLPWST